MTEEKSRCEININSTASLNVSRRDLVKLGDRIDYLDSNLKHLQRAQADLQRMEDVQAELAIERSRAARTPEQITLAMSEATREKELSILDAIKKVKEESQGSAPRAEVQARAKAIGIDEEEFEDILRRLRRAGALVESEGMLRLI
jgi:DNA replicative helicase MCM subunit Mcm2 (Cdc46/Mcm family)